MFDDQNEPEQPRAGTLYEHSTVINVSQPGRVISAALGASMIYMGLADIGRSPFKSLCRLATGGYLLYRGLSGNCPLSAMVEDSLRPHHARSVNIRTTLIVDRPRDEVYAFWRNLDNLPVFMKHLKHVEIQDSTHSRWTVDIPGFTLEWDAEIVDEVENEMIGWRSLEGAAIANAGKVTFRDTVDGGTQLHIVFSYRPPAGYAGESLARLLNPAFEMMVRKEIRSFKKHIERSPNQV